jgi:uncharacterized protein YeaO (DUF488 family)
MASRRNRQSRDAVDEAASGAYSSPACYLHEFEPPPPVRSSGRGVEIKRIYDLPDGADGYRVLIDRLWPRGMSKRRAALDVWLAELAPTSALRSWFHRDLTRWSEFARRYRAELRSQAPLLQTLRQRARQQRVTLLYAARDTREALRSRAALRLRAALRSPDAPASALNDA